MASFNIGDLISFSYPAVHQQGTRAHDKHPQVLVLHNNWEGLVHGLNFNYLTDDEINTVRMILDPSFEMHYRDALARKNPAAFNELENILTGKVDESEGPHSRMSRITSPRAFYLNIIRPFIITRGWDPYRLYRIDKMSNVRIVQKVSTMTGADAMAQWRAQQSAAIDKMQQKPKGVMQWFKDKFQHQRGPTMPRFRSPTELPDAGKPKGPGALPGTRDKK